MEEPSRGEQGGPACPEAEPRMAAEEAAAAEAAGEEEREARPELEPEPEREDNQLTEAALPPAPAAGSAQEFSEDLNSDEENESKCSEDSSCSDYGSHDRPGTTLQRIASDGKAVLPDIFQTNNLLFYERFKTYQDYMLADCKASEVKEFTAEYLEKVLEPSGWQAIWCTNAFEVLVEVADVDYASLKAVVRLSQPFRCRVQVGGFTSEQVCALLELKEYQLPLQELSVVYYDIVEDRVSPTLVSDYHNRLSQCEELYGKFQVLRNSLLACVSDSEKDNVSVVEGMKLYDQIEHLKQKLKMIENLLFRDKLTPEHFNEEIEIQFHNDPQSALNACYEGDRVIICPGHYIIEGALSVADSVTLEGYGLPDDIVIEKQGKVHAFMECAGKDVKISNLKLIQHDAVKGILSVHQGRTTLENCVLQCETTGVAIRTSAEFLMKNSDLYGSKGAGIEIYPGSTCTLIGNGLHHCKEGILIKNFLDDHCDVPKITMKNNVIHNNEGYGVVLVKPKEATEQMKESTSADGATTENYAGLHELGSSEVGLYGRDNDDDHGEGNLQISEEIWATLLKKNQLCQKRRSQLGIPEAASQMSQEMFVSIMGNQFKRNGKGCFGTFLY
ncbi:hypothetical protein Chor_013412 [Crotalus horridus]